MHVFLFQAHLNRRDAPAFRWTDIRRNKARNVALLNEEAALYRREAKKGFGDDVPERVWTAAQKRKDGMSRREDISCDIFGP